MEKERRLDLSRERFTSSEKRGVPGVMKVFLNAEVEVEAVAGSGGEGIIQGKVHRAPGCAGTGDEAHTRREFRAKISDESMAGTLLCNANLAF
jgi:hypothetical protein